MMELLMTNAKPTGPLEEARENLECFADSMIQQHMLRAIADAYITQQVIAIVLGDEVQDDQLQKVWTKLADDFATKGISA